MLLARSLVALSAIATVAVPAHAQTQWTVDDDGPADFSSISEAIPLVAPGDILLVAPGLYSGFHLDKALVILGDPSERPEISGPCSIVGADYFVLSQLKIFAGSLRVTAIPGRSSIHSCLVLQTLAEIDGASELVIQSSEFQGENGVGGGQVGKDALHINGASKVNINQSTITGGLAANPSFPCMEWEHLFAGDSVLVSGASELSLVECDLNGGSIWHCAGPFHGPGTPGSPLTIRDQSTVVWRDSGDAGLNWTYNVTVEPEAELIWSSPTQPHPIVGLKAVSNPPLPALHLAGSAAPGGQQTVELHADPATAGVLFISTDPAWIESSDLYGADIWLALNGGTAIVPIQPTGIGTPATFSWTSPDDPAFSGFTATCQAGVLNLVDYSWAATNPVEVLVGY